MSQPGARYARPPSGTVTFLFTDSEGSTTLWEQQAALMQDAFRRHGTILREAIAVHDGYAYKMIEDAFEAAFQTAPPILRSAPAVIVWSPPPAPSSTPPHG